MKTTLKSVTVLLLMLSLLSAVNADNYQNIVSGHVYSTPPMLPAFIPLANANVYLIGSGITLHAISDEEGSYEFLDIAPGKYLISAEAEHHVPAYDIDTLVVEEGTQITDLNIYLTPYDDLGVATLSGFIGEKDSDTPVYPAYIALFPATEVLSNVAIPIDYMGISVVNNPDGTYKIENLPAGIYHVMCSARGYVSQYVTNVELHSGEVTLDFYLEPLEPGTTNLLAGTVLNEKNNNPVPNAIVTLTNLDGPEILYRTKTNREGYYQFRHIYPGNYEIQVLARGFQVFSETLQIEEDTWLTDFDIYLKPIINDILVTLYGYVWEDCTDLKPVYPAQIILIGYTGSGESIVYHTENNPDGSYRIDNIIPATYMVICYAPGFQTKIIHDLPLFQPTHRLDFHLSPITYKWGYITGRVYFDKINTPVHGAKIRFISANAVYHHTVSDINGNYIVRLPVGKYYVLCSYHDPDGNYYYQEYYDDVHSIAEATPVPVEPNQITPDIDFGIPHPQYTFSVTISGRVTDNEGNALEKALITVWQINVPSFSSANHRYFTWTDEYGDYKITIDLNLNTWMGPLPMYGFIVSAEKEDFKTVFYNQKPAPYLADVLWAFHETVFTDINFKLDPISAPNSISGTLTSDTGDPLPQAFILGVNAASGEIVFTYSNDMGEYTLKALNPDYYYLLFTAPGYVPEFFNDVYEWEKATSVLAVGSVGGIDADLTPIYWDSYNGIVAGKVYDNSEKPLAGVLVIVKNDQGFVIGYAITDNSGGYEIKGISDGNYQVFATKVNYNTKSSMINFNLTESEMLLLDFTLDQSLTNLPHHGDEHANLPTQIQLLTNYPNPFNPVTHIQFAVPATQHVRLSIYNILGKRIKILVNDVLPAGWHKVQWDASDENGRQISSGIYFYALEVAEQRIVKKLIFNK